MDKSRAGRGDGRGRMRTASKVKLAPSMRKDGSRNGNASKVATGVAATGQETEKGAKEHWERSVRKEDRDIFRMKEWGSRLQLRRVKNGLGLMAMVSTLVCRNKLR